MEMKLLTCTVLAVLAIMTEGTKDGFRGMNILEESLQDACLENCGEQGFGEDMCYEFCNQGNKQDCIEYCVEQGGGYDYCDDNCAPYYEEEPAPCWFDTIKGWFGLGP